MKRFVTWLAVCLTLIGGQATGTRDKKRVLYNGYRLLSVGPLASDADVTAIEQLLLSHGNNKQISLTADSRLTVGKKAWLVVAPSNAFGDAKSMLMRHQIAFEVVNEDIQRTMNENVRLNNEALAVYQVSTNDSSNTQAVHHIAYLRYSEQVLWMQNKVAEAGSFAVAFPLGTSYEARSIYAVGVNDGNTNLPAIWIHGNLNARDWLSSATALYIIDEILTGTSADAVFLRTNFRFFITPNLNPDGYEYTWDFDRAWMKTLSYAANQVNCSVQTGVYAVGNFNANFGGAGCNPDPCSDTYCGANAFSEPETMSVRDFMTSLTGTRAMFLSIDSFGQQWLLPWGCSLLKPSDYNEMNRVALKGADAIFQVSQKNFTVGTPGDLTGISTGAGFDWSKLTHGFNYAYSVRTRPATAGLGGFDVPPDQIIPSGQEVFAGLVTACREIVV